MALPENGFGITVMLPGCAFQAEIGRDGIEETVTMIEEEISGMTKDEDPVVRMTYAIMHALDISHDLAEGELDRETAVSEIAFSFIYGYAVQHGVGAVLALRGLIGIFSDDEVVFKACPNADEYDRASAEMKVITDRRSGNLSDQLWSAGHTIH